MHEHQEQIHDEAPDSEEIPPPLFIFESAFFAYDQQPLRRCEQATLAFGLVECSEEHDQWGTPQTINCLIEH